jgi:hypothetical protein
MLTIFSGGDGIIYAIKPTGELLWYQDTLRNGTNGAHAEQGWASNSGSQIGYEWDQFVHVFSAGNGVIYGVRVGEFGGNLFWYRDLLRNGTNGPDASQGWDASSQSVGSGWQIAPIEGYCWPLSARPGESIDFFISTHSTYYVVFIVKPKLGEHKGLLVLANTNTWNAYNTWGGNSNYSIHEEKILSYARPNLHLLNCPQDHTKGNHMLRSEIWLLDWLNVSDYEYDVFTDVDLDLGIENMANYKAVILSTHPEYWSLAMQDNLQAYLDQGGKLLYLGGNGMYRIVNFSPDHLGFSTASLDGPELFRNNGRGERRIFGIAYPGDATNSSYTVSDASHRFLLGFNNRDEIGLNGRNGAASGWEVDVVRPDPPDDTTIPDDDPDRSPRNTVVLARKTNSGEGNMVYREIDNGNGGFVFSVGSICFVGSLVEEESLRKIVGKVLNECLKV